MEKFQLQHLQKYSEVVDGRNDGYFTKNLFVPPVYSLDKINSIYPYEKYTYTTFKDLQKKQKNNVIWRLRGLLNIVILHYFC